MKNYSSNSLSLFERSTMPSIALRTNIKENKNTSDYLETTIKYSIEADKHLKVGNFESAAQSLMIAQTQLRRACELFIE